MAHTKKYGISRSSRKGNKIQSYICFWHGLCDGSRPSPACQSHLPHSHPTSMPGGLQTHFRYAPARSCPGHYEAVGPNPKAREPGRGKPAGGAKAGLDSNSCGGKPYKSKPYKQAQHSRRLVELDVTVIPRRCIAGPQLKLYSCTTLHNYSRFRVLGT